jgi:OOP family OmpA-OmpF porin
MKNLVLYAFILFSLNSFAQSFHEKLFVDLHVGSRFGGLVSDSSNLRAGFHIDGGIGYEISDFYAIKFDMGYDVFSATQKSNTKILDKSLLIRGSIQGFVNVSQLIGFKTDSFCLEFHGGIGFATISNPNFKDDYIGKFGNFKDKGIKGNDDMFNFILGLTPTYKISEKIAVNADISLILLTSQSNYIDRMINRTSFKDVGTLFNTSVGITYRL